MPNWNLQQFKMRMSAWSRQTIPAAVVAVQKRLALELFTKIIMRTPVDKGFLRGAWTISLQNPDTSNAGKVVFAGGFGDPISSQEKAFMDTILEAVTQLPLGQVIWLANAMPYVERIEFEGWSKQWPTGMVSTSLSELQAGIIQAERALGK